MRLDGSKVEVGDSVWHDRYGYGKVMAVNGGTCDVRFSGSETAVTFADGGIKGGYKVLWWQEPLLYVPEKGKNYDGLKEMVSSLMNFKYGDGV